MCLEHTAIDHSAILAHSSTLRGLCFPGQCASGWPWPIWTVYKQGIPFTYDETVGGKRFRKACGKHFSSFIFIVVSLLTLPSFLPSFLPRHSFLGFSLLFALCIPKAVVECISCPFQTLPRYSLLLNSKLIIHYGMTQEIIISVTFIDKTHLRLSF